MQLRERMALYGFESNEEYDYPVDCLLNGAFEGIRCLNIEGDSQRRKTAFASALANAMEIPHIIYHDFSEQHPPPPEIVLPPSRDENGKEEPPIAALDSRFADACGFSEAEPTVLILDQLHTADFREHIRIYRFVTSGEWQVRGATHQANKSHLLLFLVSEEPLYHSLQKQSFRVWVGNVSHRQIPYTPEEFSLEEDAVPLMESLSSLFTLLQMSPTKSEYARLLRDVVVRVRDREGLRCSLYGWTEGVEREILYDTTLEESLDAVIDEVLRYVGCQEVELAGLPDYPESPTGG